MSKEEHSPPFEHALHNFKAYGKLKEIGEFNDWVVTTSFYSALKFMEDKLFPGDYIHPKKGIQDTFKSFDLYFRACSSLTPTNKHRVLANLVDEHISDRSVVNSYNDLKSACHTARYINYKVGEDRVTMCSEAIEIIKNFCCGV